MEKRIRLQVRDKFLRGILTIPKNPKGCVVLASGFLISMDGPNGLFYELAKKLHKKGYAVLRFTYTNVNGTKKRETSLQRSLEEFKSVVEYAKKSFAKVYVIGYSFSGTLGLLSGRAFHKITKMILLAPLIQLKLFATRDWKEMRRLKKQYKIKYRTILRLLIYYFIQRGRLNFKQIVRGINIPLLVIHGDKDKICDFSMVPKIFKKKNTQVNLLHGADHSFKGWENDVIEQSVSWLIKEEQSF